LVRHRVHSRKDDKMTADKICKVDEYEIHCFARRNKHGFTHRAIVWLGEEKIAEVKCQYYNRTWERFEFESVISNVLRKAGKTHEHIKEILDNLANENHKEINRTFGSVALVAKMGEVFGQTTKEKNDWKARMLKAGLGNMGLTMPEDWENLDEETKQARLDAVINHLGKTNESN